MRTPPRPPPPRPRLPTANPHVVSRQENHSREKVAENLKTRDINIEYSDTITSWACATRETLFRVVNGLDLESIDSDKSTSTEQPAL